MNKPLLIIILIIIYFLFIHKNEKFTNLVNDGLVSEKKKNAVDCPFCKGDGCTDCLNLMDFIKEFPTLQHFYNALIETDVDDILKKKGPFTVFIPSQDAWEKIPPSKRSALLKDKETLKKVIMYHIVPGRLMYAYIKDGTVNSISEKPITIIKKDDTFLLNNKAKIMGKDVLSNNGVIHMIDTVLLPSDVTL
jgi:uncharacterized surface protein with fasciclin (FAS1) repeats